MFLSGTGSSRAMGLALMSLGAFCSLYTFLPSFVFSAQTEQVCQCEAREISGCSPAHLHRLSCKMPNELKTRYLIAHAYSVFGDRRGATDCIGHSQSSSQTCGKGLMQAQCLALLGLMQPCQKHSL